MADITGRLERIADAEKTFSTANPHCLHAIIRLSRETAVTACRDIVDEHGTRLWARGATISAAIEAALGERRLQPPLETCLDVDPRIVPADIAADCLTLMSLTPALALLGCGGAVGLARAVGKLPPGGPLTVLLTLAKTLNRGSYQTSLARMIVCSGLAHGLALSESDGDALILAALVNDIGELYINPALVDDLLPASEWQQVAAHPVIGHAFLTAFTDLPSIVADCVLQHHERQDGSGYPLQLGAASINPLAVLSGLADCVAAVLISGTSEFALDTQLGSCVGERVTVAVSIVPGEFPPRAVAFIIKALVPLAEVGAGIAGGSFAQRVLPTLQQIRSARLLAEALSNDAPTPALAAIGDFSRAAIRVLDASLRATGVYDIAQLGMFESDALLMGKTCLVLDEVRWRLRHLARRVYLRTAQSGDDVAPIGPLVAVLSGLG